MARLSKTEQLYKVLRDESRARPNTFKGSLAFIDRSIQDQSTMTALSTIRSDFPLTFEIPTREHSLAYIVQEMILVSSRLQHACERLAYDAAMDDMADNQPFTIKIHGEKGQTREKILEACHTLVRRTKLGYKGKAIVYRAMIAGDTIAQPIYEEVDGMWRLTKFAIMPTWEMHFDPNSRQWQQRKGSQVMGNRPVAEWPVPDYMVRMIHAQDDNRVYGIPLLANQIVNYRQYLLALEDLVAASRTRATRRYKFMYGPKDGHVAIDPTKLSEFRKRQEMQPKTIAADLFLIQGMEDAEVLQGDSQGMKELVENVVRHERRMLLDMGLPPEPDSLRGQRVSDSVDAAYASRINDLRLEYAQFVIDLLQKGLLLEGYSDIDMSILMPTILEAPSVRFKRATDAFMNSIIPWDMTCAIIGEKNPDGARKKIEEDIKWKLDHGIPPFIGTTRVMEEIGQGVDEGPEGKTENPDKGVPAQPGRTRRQEQRKQGRTPTGK